MGYLIGGSKKEWSTHRGEKNRCFNLPQGKYIKKMGVQRLKNLILSNYRETN
jgi:hypothetical protein